MSSPDLINPPQSTSSAKLTASQVESVSTGGSNHNPLDKLPDLEKRLEALEKSDKSSWKKAGVIVGLLAGIFAIPKGISDFLTTITPPVSKVELTWIDDVDLKYDSQTQKIDLVYNLSISNAKGTAEDRITSASITLQAPQSEPYTVGTPYIYFQTNQQKMKIPLTIGKGESKDVELHVSFIPAFAKHALAKPGTRETEVSFSLQSRPRDKPISKKFCLLDMDSEDLKAVMEGQPWHPSMTSCKKG